MYRRFENQRVYLNGVGKQRHSFFMGKTNGNKNEEKIGRHTLMSLPLVFGPT